MKSKRQIAQEQRRRKKWMSYTALGVFTLLMIALLANTVFGATRPQPGEEVAVMADITHVAEGTDPGPYNSDPPTSGRHYPGTLEPGFYESGQVNDPYPAGFLVHNLEHGYVIFWYNCEIINEVECSDLKTQIREVMSAENNFKVIAFPWESIDVPVVMTSWGRMLRFDQFDPEQAQDFVQRNRNKAPEPFAP
jgi:hypothetical protein